MLVRILMLVFAVGLVGYLIWPPPLPAHHVLRNMQIDATTLNRRKIIIYAPQDLTRDGCRALLSHYGRDLADRSRVVVEKLGLNGFMKPWCIDNHDGAEIVFLDHWFDPTLRTDQPRK